MVKCKWYLCENEVDGVTRKFCSRNCTSKASVTRKRQKLKLQALEYKGGKCVKCGYDNSVNALQFHHLDPKQKDFGIASSGHTRSWDKIKIELDKCILICANCHAEEHELEYRNKVGDSLELTGWNSRVRLQEYCEDCNKELSYNSRKKTKKCRKCFRESMCKITDSLEVVKSKVLESNINRVAKEYGVSFTAMKKFVNK